MPTLAVASMVMPAVTPAVISPSTPSLTSKTGVTTTGTGPTMMVTTESVRL